MIGQTRLKEQIKHQLELGKYPAFTIFVGPKGCGKKTLFREVFAHQIEVGTTVDEIREFISKAYTYKDDVTFGIFGADNLSPAASNALLKVAEEPPRNARIVLTCDNIENVLTTIRSRAVVYQFDPYSYEEKCDFCDFRNIVKDDFILEMVDTFGDIETISKYDGFKEFVELVIDNIASVSGSNAFKIADKIALKDTDKDKYDLRLFLMAFSSICVDYMLNKDPNNCMKFSNAVAITGEAIADLNIKSVNKGMLFDKWLLDIRSAWM